jgi:hypothetical protein
MGVRRLWRYVIAIGGCCNRRIGGTTTGCGAWSGDERDRCQDG